jgi:hypothetical protein
LGQDATIIVLVFDKQTKDPLGYRVITLHSDTSVDVGELIQLPDTNLPELPGPDIPSTPPESEEPASD